MKSFFLTIAVLVEIFICSAQKPMLDTSVFSNWPSIGMEDPIITNDGRYCAYNLNSLIHDKASTIVQLIKGNWKLEIKGSRNLNFSNDSRQLVYLKPNDTLSILTLGSSSEFKMPNVSSFKLFLQGKTEWLLYHRAAPDKELVALDLEKKVEQSFENVSSYLISKDGGSLLLEMQEQTQDNTKQQLILVNLANKRHINFWNGANSHSFVFDAKGKQLAFMVDDPSYIKTTASSNILNNTTIWYYRVGEEKATLLADNKLAGIPNNFQLRPGREWGFSDNGNYIFFTVLQNERKYATEEKVSVSLDVWSYTDPLINSRQLDNKGNEAVAFINCKTHRMGLLEGENDQLRFRNNDYALVCNRTGDYLEYHWSILGEAVYYVIDFATGVRRQVKTKIQEPIGFSPNGKFFVFTGFSGSIYSYEFASGKIVNISEKLPVSLLPEKYDIAASKNPTMPELAGWTKKVGDLLYYDKYDIWKFDITGYRAPVNLTNSLGRKDNIKFRILQFNHLKPVISEDHPILLLGFNRKTKDAGYYRLSTNGGDPQLLCSGRFNPLGNPFSATTKDHYLLFLESASQSPNLFHTSDFRKFDSLTAIYPEKNYNWLTSEIVKYKTLDGREVEGALYKPENFDSMKKYPVIFNYYGVKSDEVNHYEKPEASPAWINLPWFVSHGYIVFCPDTYSALGEPGIGAYNSVVGAAKHLMKFSWVDSAKMAIHGHSFGGFLNNYILTQTSIFSAALTSAGEANLISAYSYRGMQGFHEFGQFRLGASIWQNKKAYLDQTPVLHADKVSTPLLMLHNKNDGAVPFAQGVEFFSALRRLGKRAWMLQYDNAAHSHRNENDAIDYTIRITQFFDHYLKDSAAPRWMLYGIPASQKGIDNGLQLVYEKDKSGKWITPKAGGLLTEEEKKKVEVLKRRKPITITTE